MYVQLERYLRLHDLSLYTAFFFRRRVTPPVLRLYKNFVHWRCHPIFSLCISLLNKNMPFQKKMNQQLLVFVGEVKIFGVNKCKSVNCQDWLFKPRLAKIKNQKVIFDVGKKKSRYYLLIASKASAYSLSVVSFFAVYQTELRWMRHHLLTQF